MRFRLEETKALPDVTLKEALSSMDHSTAGIVLVCDEAGRLLGTLTDGDLRRALLGGATLDSPVFPFASRKFIAVDPQAARVEVLDLMHARSIQQVPVVAADGVLVGLHLMRDVLGGPSRPHWAVIMAGGKGTRLGPLTKDVPKPMLRVAGRPILERIVLHLVSHGIRRIFLSVNYLAHIVEEHFGDGSRLGVRIEYLRETKPLGTGGPLALLPEKPTRPLVVMNGDLVTQTNIGAMIDLHERSKSLVTVGVRRYLHTVPFGCVELEGDRIVSLEEKPTLARLINAGIYVVEPALLDRVPANEEFPITSLLEGAIERAEAVRAFEIVDDWIDVGRRDQLAEARGSE